MMRLFTSRHWTRLKMANCNFIPGKPLQIFHVDFQLVLEKRFVCCPDIKIIRVYCYLCVFQKRHSRLMLCFFLERGSYIRNICKWTVYLTIVISYVSLTIVCFVCYINCYQIYILDIGTCTFLSPFKQNL
jgi:hypothetical protein